MQYHRILVAKLRHHGDVLLTSPLFTFLKETFPKATIDAYIYKETVPMLEGHPAISGFIVYDKSKKKNPFAKAKQELSLLWKIFRAKYDLVINLTEGDRAAIAAFVSRAKTRVGIDPEGSGMAFKSCCYTHLSRKCPHLRHTVERHFDVVRTIGLFPAYAQRELVLSIPETAYLKVLALLQKNHIQAKNFVVLHPVSRWLFKCLPEKTVAQILAFLVEKEIKVILTGSSDPEEIAMNERILSLYNHPYILNMSGLLSLKELCALIDLSSFLICVDSLPLHIASCLKKEVLAVFGPTSERTWAPWRNPKAVVLSQEMTCRPCYRPGCGDSKKSDCLETFPIEKIIESLQLHFVSQLEIHA